MASSAKDIQLRELKDTISQLNTIMSEQTELIRSLRTIIEEKTAHEMVLQEQVDYLTKKLFGSSSEKTPADIPGQLEERHNQYHSLCISILSKDDSSHCYKRSHCPN